MQKDLKIGMLVGLVLVMAVMLCLSIGPGLSPKAEGPDPRSNPSPQEDPATTNNFSTNGLTAQSTEDNQSKLPDSTIYEQTEKIKTQKFHIVRKGETLSEISRKYYDSANKWQMILEANRQIIKDVNKLRPGTKLIIPE
jgi:nucleoid-associated protein YgaU